MSIVSLALLAVVSKVPSFTVPDEPDEIIVTGSAKPYQLSGKQLVTAARVFAKYRPVFAPQGRLLFEVRRKSGRNLHGLRLSLRTKTSDIPLLLDGQSRFVLPANVDKNWQLVANRGSGSLKIYPMVLSPGTSPDDRLLGDM